jgi:hypothetical protein
VQFAITRVAVPRRANGPDPEPPLGVREHVLTAPYVDTKS